MPNKIFKFEDLILKEETTKSKGLTTKEQRYEYLKSELVTLQDSPETIRNVAEAALPGLNVTFSGEEVERRMRLSEHAREVMCRKGAELGGVTVAPGTPRAVVPLFRPGQDEESVAYNNRLSAAILNKDQVQLGKMYNEYLDNLPSYDAEALLSIPDEEIVEVFCALYPVYVAVQETENVPKAGKTFCDQISDRNKERIEKMKKDMMAFAKVKLTCDNMLSPYFAYLDMDKICSNSETAERLSEQVGDGGPAGVVSDVFKKVVILAQSSSYYMGQSLGQKLEILLEAKGLDPKTTTLRDASGKTYDLLAEDRTGCKAVLERDEPIYCTNGDKLYAFTWKDGKLVENHPAMAMNNCLEAKCNKANDILNGSTADPFWMITGSSQYRDMKRAMAAYRKQVKDGVGQVELADLDAYKALEKVKSSAEAYLRYKKVDLDACPDFQSFADAQGGNLSERELARMKAAYAQMEFADMTLGSFEMRRSMGELPAFTAPEWQGKKAERTYTEKVQQMNEKIRSSSFLTEPLASADADHLRQELSDALFNQKDGFLNRKFFTAQDRKVVEDTLAKAVILNMLRVDGKTNTPSAMAAAYRKTPGDVIASVKKSDAFREAMGEGITPDGLRNFLAENRQVAVHKDYVKAASKPTLVAQEGILQKVKDLDKWATNQAKKETAAPKGRGL